MNTKVKIGNQLYPVCEVVRGAEGELVLQRYYMMNPTNGLFPEVLQGYRAENGWCLVTDDMEIIKDGWLKVLASLDLGLVAMLLLIACTAWALVVVLGGALSAILI